jgi:hypothetical protein
MQEITQQALAAIKRIRPAAEAYSNLMNGRNRLSAVEILKDGPLQLKLSDIMCGIDHWETAPISKASAFPTF